MHLEKQKVATNLQEGYQKFRGKGLIKVVVHIEVTLIRITQTQRFMFSQKSHTHKHRHIPN
jgi:hypothetical protein